MPTGYAMSLTRMKRTMNAYGGRPGKRATGEFSRIPGTPLKKKKTAPVTRRRRRRRRMMIFFRGSKVSCQVGEGERERERERDWWF